MKRTLENLPLVLCALAWSTVWQAGPLDGQLLSNGASDWYMRFHGSSRFKRGADGPSMKSFQVQSVIKHRYVTTQVRLVIQNTVQVNQTYMFGYVMAKSALVSNVTLVNNHGDTVKSSVDASEWGRKFINSAANGHSSHSGANGHDSEVPHHYHEDVDPTNGGEKQETFYENQDDINHDYLHHRADFKQFVLPVNIQPSESITLTLTYEYLLERVDDLYTHSLSIAPGEIVPDFQIRIVISENRPLTGLRVVAPLIGDITNDTVRVLDGGREATVNLNLTVTDQGEFGKHGFIGDFEVSYDMAEDEKVVDLIVQDDFFVHYFTLPSEDATKMPSLSKHIIFLLDVSDSMAGTKLEHAKQSVEIMLEGLDESRDYVNLFVFDNDTRPVVPAGLGNHSQYDWKWPKEAFQCTNETRDDLMSFLDENHSAEVAKVSNPANVANITLAIETAINAEDFVRHSVPDNALTMIVLITDGRSVGAASTHSHPHGGSDVTHVHTASNEESVSRTIRQLNKAPKIPIFTLGVGFDANVKFLENVAEVSCGKSCTGLVIEDIDTAPQLRAVQQHLDDVVLKNIELDYMGSGGASHLTKSQFKVFHQGSSIAVSGQFDSDNPVAAFSVKITGQSSNGPFEYSRNPVPFVTNGCYSDAILCSQPSFKGTCVSINSSMASLKDLNDFNRRTWSVNITGNCKWIAYKEENYVSPIMTLLPGGYEALPAGVHKKISSMRIVAIESGSDPRNPSSRTPRKMMEGTSIPTNSVARLWAFTTIKEALENAADNVSTTAEIEVAYSTAMKYHFLTPFTNMMFFPAPKHDPTNRFQTEPAEEPSQRMLNSTETILTYGELSPIFYAAMDDGLDTSGLQSAGRILKGCEPPIICQGHFHYEVFEDNENPEFLLDSEAYENSTSEMNCDGTITLHTKPEFEGESLTLDQGVSQLYHDFKSQRMRSIRSEGDCCWLLFANRFFAGGKVDRLCGNEEIALRLENIGSIERRNSSKR